MNKELAIQPTAIKTLPIIEIAEFEYEAGIDYALALGLTFVYNPYQLIDNTTYTINNGKVLTRVSPNQFKDIKRTN